MHNSISRTAALISILVISSALVGQTWIKNPANGHYYTITKNLTWVQAKQQAARLGGQLVTINNAAENDWIFKTFYASQPWNTYVYIGFTDEAKEGTWVWDSGEPVTYTNWASGRPDNVGNQDYGVMWHKGEWDDTQSNAYQAIIERNTPAWIKNPANGHLYAVTSNMSWKQAEAQAVKWGGHLATVRNKAENDWIFSQFAKLATKWGMWIGYTDEAKEGTWVWVSGESATYTRWSSGNPNNQSGVEHYGHILGLGVSGAGFWNDAADAGGLIGVVERDHPSFQVFGKGCASTTTLPTISGTPPRLGQNFTLEIKGFLPKPQFGQIIFGVSNTRWGVIPLPLSLAVLGMGNCNLLVSLDTSVLIVTDPQGSFKTTMKVPSSPSLLGAEVYGQAWVPDPKSNALGVAMTNGFKAVVGQ